MSTTKSNFLSELNDIDWDFSGEKATNGMASSHWYPARFVPQVPGVLIGFLTEPGTFVLDPFCGSGTTMVEARRLGRRSVGIDTNRAAVLISQSRLAYLEPDKFIDSARQLGERAAALLISGLSLEAIPNFDENRRWYETDTLRELAAIWTSIDGPIAFQQIAYGVFSGILRQVCSQDKHWGWICDNVQPREFVYRPALSVFMTRLYSHERLLKQLESDLALCSADVVFGGCKDVMRGYESASVDAVVTSPPYFGMTDYIRSQRLTYLWFGWSIEDDRLSETGARYKRRRQSAWSDYMSEMTAAFTDVSRVLRPGGFCAIVAGESPDRQPYLEDFKGVLVEQCGLEIQTVLHRTVARQRALSSRRQVEEIIIARRG